MKNIIAIIFVILAVVYGVLISTGIIVEDNRLGAFDIVVITSLIFVSILISSPAAAEKFSSVLNRITRIRVPGNIEVELEKIKERQDKIDSLMGLLAQNLSMAQKYHLRALLRDTEEYKGRHTLRAELVHLKKLGLIELCEGQSINDLHDDKIFDLKQYVKLTGSGELLARSLCEIDGHD